MKIIYFYRTAGWLFVALALFSGCSIPEPTGSIDRKPQIYPDYSGIIVPPNIAPLNFEIVESGQAFIVRAVVPSGKSLVIKSMDGIVRFPVRKWNQLLSENRKNTLIFEILAKDSIGNWSKFKPITNTIAADAMDSHLVYRLIIASRVWHEMGIYQRNLSNFEVKPIFLNRTADHGCVNCHVFCQNDPDKMSLHLRLKYAGTVITDSNRFVKVNTKTDFTMSAAIYPSWHPGGNLVAYSVNRLGQYYSSLPGHGSEVCDDASDIVVYNIKENTITTSPKISTSARENIPSWSADGKYLYYLMAPEKTDFRSHVFPKYSLMRIAFDETTGVWGEPEVILSAPKIGRSITFPRMSPDGRFLIFGMANHGYFSINYQNSDLYIMDMKDFSYRPLEINSPDAESTACWSMNSKWIVFASKRRDGNYSIPYFCAIDSLGHASKPFILPQENPLFYNDFLQHINIPVFTTGEIAFDANELRDFIYNEPIDAQFDTAIDVDALSGASYIHENMAEIKN